MVKRRFRSYEYRRTSEQEDFAKRHPKCRVCFRASEHIHHIEHNRRDDRDENLEAFCAEHHRLVHLYGDVKFCEWFQLTKDPKWIDRYERHKGKLGGHGRI